tara:strand:- start:4160 stop:4381 length:222 start_codon:yes stop_codon:yes gene_type:complete
MKIYKFAPIILCVGCVDTPDFYDTSSMDDIVGSCPVEASPDQSFFTEKREHMILKFRNADVYHQTPQIEFYAE